MIYAAEMNDGIYRWFDTDTGLGGCVNDLSWFENVRILENTSSIDEIEETWQNDRECER